MRLDLVFFVLLVRPLGCAIQWISSAHGHNSVCVIGFHQRFSVFRIKNPKILLQKLEHQTFGFRSHGLFDNGGRKLGGIIIIKGDQLREFRSILKHNPFSSINIYLMMRFWSILCVLFSYQCDYTWKDCPNGAKKEAEMSTFTLQVAQNSATFLGFIREPWHQSWKGLKRTLHHRQIRGYTFTWFSSVQYDPLSTWVWSNGFRQKTLPKQVKARLSIRTSLFSDQNQISFPSLALFPLYSLHFILNTGCFCVSFGVKMINVDFKSWLKMNQRAHHAL